MPDTSRPIGNALIHLGTEVEREIETAFNGWAEEHLKENLALPGFLSARRLRLGPGQRGEGDHATYLTLYDLADLEAMAGLESPTRDRSMPEAFSGRFEFLRRLFRVVEWAPDVRNRQQRGPAVLQAMSHVEVAYRDEFLAWYGEQHLPAVLSVPGMLSARWFEGAPIETDGEPVEDALLYLTLYEMEDAEVIGRPEMLDASKATACPPRLDAHRRSSHAVYEEFLAMESVR